MAFKVSKFTSADRRKKVVTYGKKPRPSIIPTPSPDPIDEPPSPERPRKVVATTNNGSNSRGRVLKSAKILGDARATSKEPDIFEVPSDDESTFRPIVHVKRLSKHRIAATDAASSTFTQKGDAGNALQLPPKSRAVKAAAPDAKVEPKADRLPAPPQALSRQSQTTIAPQIRGGNAQQCKHNAKRKQDIQLLVANGKAMSRTTIPAVPQVSTAANPKSACVSPSKDSVRTPLKKASKHLDVFDIAPSDEEVAAPTRKSSRLDGGKVKENGRKEQLKIAQDEALRNAAESDGSNTSRKRKRRGSVSSVTTRDATVDFQPDASVPQRNRKFSKRENPVSPGYRPVKQPDMTHHAKAPSKETTINKPKRTRQLTVPVFTQRTIKKGQSSPAQLSSMLPNRSLAKASPILEVPEGEDETMYEIPDPLATPLRPSKNTTSGSVTPRQKALFSNLLGESSSKTPISGISALRLTGKNPKTLLGGLARSKSDLTYSAQARKTRLIDNLKHADGSSEDEGNDDTSDADSEASSDSRLRQERFEKRKPHKRLEKPDETRLLADAYSEDMDVEAELAVETQASQAVSTFGSRAKFTYAKARSFLEEANPEDALLISMGLDDDLGFELPNKNSASEDDDDPASQVQAHHVLKMKGQQNRFNDDVRMYIDDLPVASGNPVRRNAMLELCSRMEDEAFTSQLLDSTLANQFFDSMASNGEIIFDFAAAVAMIFLLEIGSTSVVLDQIYRTGIIASLVTLTSNELDMQTIAKNRKTNLSKMAVGSVITVCDKLLASSIWSNLALDKVTPRLVALKALESIVVGLRRSGNADSIFDQGMISTIVDMAPTIPEDRSVRPEEVTTLRMVMSILESVSVSRQKPSLWPMKTLERLADIMPIVFDLDEASSIMLAVKLCMNLTNNRPKACLPFSGHVFIQSLAAVMVRNFTRLHSEVKHEERTTVLEVLILSLGAWINLAEFSDQARLNVDGADELLGTLVKMFLEGSERAARVCIYHAMLSARHH